MLVDKIVITKLGYTNFLIKYVKYWLTLICVNFV